MTSPQPIVWSISFFLSSSTLFLIVGAQLMSVPVSFSSSLDYCLSLSPQQLPSGIVQSALWLVPIPFLFPSDQGTPSPYVQGCTLKAVCRNPIKKLILKCHLLTLSLTTFPSYFPLSWVCHSIVCMHFSTKRYSGAGLLMRFSPWKYCRTDAFYFNLCWGRPYRGNWHLRWRKKSRTLFLWEDLGVPFL